MVSGQWFVVSSYKFIAGEVLAENYPLNSSNWPLLYRGVESGNPPSTGIVAPVVGVCRVAK